MTLSLAPDRTCRLKFPVVAEELIEYSGARHEERSRRTSTGKLWVPEGKLSPPPPFSSSSKSAYSRTMKKRHNAMVDGKFFSDLSIEKFHSPCFIHLLLLVPTIKTAEIIHKEMFAA